MSSRPALLAVMGLAVAPLAAGAQDWRDVTSFRQRSDESRLDVRVRYGAGELMIRPGDAGELYRVALRYDSDVFDPVTHYRSGELEVGVERRGGGLRIRNTEAGELRLQLSPDVPLDLDLDFGAVEADLDLGGMQISSLDVETGASETELRFDEANRAECDQLKIAMGAASFVARGLGNAGCGTMKVEGGVGELTLDFAGTWTRDMDADITMALGSVTLVVPDDVGVQVDKEAFLIDFDHNGFLRRDDLYYSENWDGATHRLRINLKGAFGSLNIRRASPTVPARP